MKDKKVKKVVVTEATKDGKPQAAKSLTECEIDLRRLLNEHLRRGEHEIANQIKQLLNIKTVKDTKHYV